MDKNLLWWIFGVTKGGIWRAKIIQSLKDKPANANQLANSLGLNYTTIRYHLDMLVKHNLVKKMEEGGITMYFLGMKMEESYPEFNKICKKLGIET
jgi:DNA-binding transcriptional ArsR family regulator